MSSEIECVNDHDAFCFVCGHRIFYDLKKRADKKTEPKRRYVDAPKFVDAYKNKFQRDPLQRNLEWSPKVSCNPCYNKLTNLDRQLKLESPMEWFVPQNHPEDCYFCKTIVPPDTNKHKEHKIEYADLPSVKKARLESGAENVETIDASQVLESGGDTFSEISYDANFTPTDENVAVEKPMIVEPADRYDTDDFTQIGITNPFNIQDSARSYASRPI